jgi:iron-sulfur cluster repair protein YtfE (RIC family)
VESVSTGQAPEVSLSRALEQEHREIDDALKSCADGATPGVEEKAALQRAVDELRRHIYTEEELLFPPLRHAGMLGPILVMLREHAEMWPLLDTLDHGLVEDVDEDVLRTTCRHLLVLLQHHNPKEEQIVYPEIDRVVDVDARLGVHEFLDAGQVPADWTCHFLRLTDGRG